MESNEFQVWANTGGNMAKRERKFLLGKRRGVKKRGFVRRSSHCTKCGKSRFEVYVEKKWEEGVFCWVGVSFQAFISWQDCLCSLLSALFRLIVIAQRAEKVDRATTLGRRHGGDRRNKQSVARQIRRSWPSAESTDPD